ncbi:MAG: DUF1800 domain-containing protein [Actinomycetota bacterium]
MADRSLVAHLFRRAAFGARPAELDYYGSRSYDTAVADLLSGRSLMGQTPSLDEAIAPVNRPLQNLRGRAAPAALNEIQTAWLRGMVTTTIPLVERMTLFLHDHFATAYRPGDTVDSPELTAQNDVFRANALGNWRTICHAMLDDVALSCWLDNNINVKGHPNENLAREFMELFTLGTGTYTETDVREAARALTGMTVGFNLSATGSRNAMVFDAKRHDAGVKTILGRSGNFLPHDVVDILLAQPAAPLFLARKLGETFVGPAPSSSFVTAIADVLVTNDWELRPALSAIFRSESFQAAASRSALVKSPAEFVTGALRALNRTDFYDQALVWMGRQGQNLYDPPTVAGWPHNEGWLGAGNVLARYNFGVQLAQTHVNAFAAPGSGGVRATTADGWGEIFGVTPLAGATRAAMDGYRAKSGVTAPAKTVDAAMITLLIGSPDFSLS